MTPAPPLHRTLDLCPGCGRLIDVDQSIASEDRAAPADGDFALCWSCGAVSRFAVVDGALVRELAEDWREVLEPHQVRVLEQARSYIGSRGPLPPDPASPT